MIAYPGHASYGGDDFYTIHEVDLIEEGFYFSSRGYDRDCASYWPYRLGTTKNWEHT